MALKIKLFLKMICQEIQMKVTIITNQQIKMEYEARLVPVYVLGNKIIYLHYKKIWS